MRITRKNYALRKPKGEDQYYRIEEREDIEFILSEIEKQRPKDWSLISNTEVFGCKVFPITNAYIKEHPDFDNQDMIIFTVDSLAKTGLGTLAVVFIPLKDVEVECRYLNDKIDYIHFKWPWLETGSNSHLWINDINISI